MEPSQESALDANSAAQVFASMIDPEPIEEREEGEPVPEPEPVEAEAVEEESPKFTIKVDGKDVEVTEAELAEAYKNGLRQSDYTKKTMEVSEQRKAAEAEIAKANAERNEYSSKLQQVSNLLQAQLQEQSQTDWNQLLENDPVEYLKQQHLFQQRQAALYQTQQEQMQIAEASRQEQEKAYSQYLKAEESSLLDKIPSWKDENVAKTEKAEIREFLKNQGFSDQDIAQVADHRHVLLVRQAMQFQKLLEKAPDATKRVEKTPPKVVRQGVSETNPQDGRTKAMQRLNKSGRVEDAASVFAQLL